MATAPINATQQTTTQQPVHQDTDGVPPGLDLSLYGAKGYLEFSGIFYAAPHMGDVTFHRRVQIIFASKEILVCLDLIRKNVYVIDRVTNVSLGCRMHATFTRE